MTVTTQDLIDAIEGSFFVLPDVPGLNTVLSIPGIEGHHGPIPSPETNIVGQTRLTKENVDSTIERVKDIFRRENKIFGWLVTPSSRPSDLATHLTRAGITLAEEAAGMMLTDLTTPIPANPAIRVKRAEEKDIKGAASMMVRAYGLPEAAAQFFSDFFTAMNTYVEFWLYLAYPHGSDEPLAWAASLFLPGRPIIVLQGAATLPEHRGQGFYSTLVARRLQDARDRGVEAAVIQGNRATSAPIAEKLGFQEICPLQIYAWDPASNA
jgi:L-amino acid N-acyltransferase YncA